MLPLIVAVALGTAASPGAALLPVRAAQADAADAPSLAALDDTLRKAAGPAVQDAPVTQANLAAARAAGIVCASDNRACLGKLAVLAEVERVLAPRVARLATGVVVRIVVVDAAGRSAEVSGPIERDDDARALVERALHAPLDAPLERATTRAPSPAPPPPSPAPLTAPAATATATATATAALPMAGIALAGAGTALLAGGGAAALVANALLATPELYEKRQGKLATGEAGIVVAVLGAATAAAGAWLVAAGY